MKICFFTENYYKGGLDTFIINLINSWPDKNDKFVLVCNETHPGLENISNNLKNLLEIRGYHRFFTSSFVQRLVVSEQIKFLLTKFFSWLHRLLEYPILFPWYVISLSFFFHRNHYDRLIVINGGYPASLLGRSALIAWRILGKRPLGIMNFHNMTTRAPWYARFFENFIDRLVIFSCSHIVSVSKNCLDSLRNRSAFIGCSKLSYIHNGIDDPARFLGLNQDGRNAKSDNQYCIMLATYEVRKGHFFLLQAFKKVVLTLPDVELRIYGYGSDGEKQKIIDEVTRLDLNKNVFVGDFIPEVASVISGASVLLVPSQSYESFGLTIIEAMALSVPVVATDVGGISEVFEGSNAGYVCSKDNPLEFANAIIKILSNPMHAHELGLNGRFHFQKKFQANQMAKKYKRLLQ